MNDYRFCFKHSGRSDHQFECDADAMMKARELLSTMQKIHSDEEVFIWCKTPDSKLSYRYVGAYK